jgi:hypothetical protein
MIKDNNSTLTEIGLIHRCPSIMEPISYALTLKFKKGYWTLNYSIPNAASSDDSNYSCNVLFCPFCGEKLGGNRGLQPNTGKNTATSLILEKCRLIPSHVYGGWWLQMFGAKRDMEKCSAHTKLKIDPLDENIPHVALRIIFSPITGQKLD